MVKGFRASDASFKEKDPMSEPKEFEDSLRGLRDHKPSGETGPDCIPTLEIGKLVAGLTNETEANEMLNHISSCSTCAWVLQQATAVLGDDEPSEPPVVVWRRFPWLVAACLALVISGGWLFWSKYQSTQPTVLIAKAYGELRPFEFRITGGDHRPYQAERAIRNSSANLARLEVLLADKLIDPPQEPYVRGVISLLSGDLDRSIAHLETAARQGPADYAAMVDLGVAYGVRAEVIAKKTDYAAALEWFTRAEHANPSLAQVYFNRALVFEKLSLLDDARRDWEKFVALEKSGPWVEEARKHLSGIENRLQKRLKEKAAVNPGVAEFTAGVPAELYLEDAFLDWVQDNLRAAEQVADVLRRDSGDDWGVDFLREAREKPQLVRALIEVRRSNKRNDPDAALQAAAQIAGVDCSSKPAFCARMNYEKSYALHRALRPGDCLKTASNSLLSLSTHRYHYLSLATRMEKEICASMSGEPGVAANVEVLATEAASRKLPAMRLRAAALGTGFRTESGDPFTIWHTANLMLEMYQDHAHSVWRAEQITYDLAKAADMLGYPAAAYRLTISAADCFAGTGNTSTEALVRATAAELARKAGFLDDAKSELSRVRQLFSALPDSKTKQLYLAGAALQDARLKLDQNDAVGALSTLGEVAPPTQLMKRQWNGIRSEALMKLDRPSEARTILEETLVQVRREVSVLKPAERGLVLASSAPAFRALTSQLVDSKPDNAWATWAEFLQDLDGDAGPASNPILVSADFGQRIGLWLVRGGQRDFVWAGISPTRFREQGEALLLAASDPLNSSVTAKGRELYSEVFGHSFLRGVENLVVVADRETESFPWDLLVDESGRFLSDRIVIRSATLGGRDRKIPAHARPLIVGEPALHSSMSWFGSLSDAREEALELASAYPNSKLLFGDQATEAQIAEKVANADFFHFAGHGFSNAGQGGLVVAPSDQGHFLTSSSIRSWNFKKNPLVVLSACLTGSGRSVSAGNPEGLVRALRFAGAGEVVAARWKVDSRATKRLMLEFHHVLRNSKTIGQALSTAKKSVRNVPEFRHPYFWAAFMSFR
jgi:tetratricopeptide (TPR) repeat protein